MFLHLPLFASRHAAKQGGKSKERNERPLCGTQ